MSNVVINNTGWYLLSTPNSNVSIFDTINSYKKNTNDTIVIYPYAYYYPYDWSLSKEFTNDDWIVVSINTNMIADIPYSILILEYIQDSLIEEPEPESINRLNIAF